MVSKLKTISKSLYIWNISHIGSIPLKIRALENELRSIQNMLSMDGTCIREAELRATLEHLYDSEYQL